MNKRIEIELEIGCVVYTFHINVTHFLVVPPSYSYDALSDLDYHGYVELKSWEVISVEDHEGDEVKPEEVLTEKQLLAYTQGLEEFVES